MTLAKWICNKCGYVIPFIQISNFIEECPECKVKYILLATLFGFHVFHAIPLYIMEGESYDKFKSNEFYAFATKPSMEKTFICYDEGFFDFLIKNKFPNSKILMVKDV